MASSQDSEVDEKFQNHEVIGEMEWVLAREGINLLINNNHAEAEALFLKYPNSLAMYSGYSFTVLLDALMSFEEEKLSKAILVLKEVEKRCTAETGWLRSISQRVFGNGTESNAQSLAEQLETQIVLADSQVLQSTSSGLFKIKHNLYRNSLNNNNTETQPEKQKVCMAILTFLQNDLSGYFKGGWVLRKAWKVYQKTYKEILTLYKERVGELPLPDPILTPVSPTSNFDEAELDTGQPSSEWNIPETQTNGYSHYSKSSISRSRSSNFSQNRAVNLVEPDDVLLKTNESINNNTKKPKPPSGLALRKSTSVMEALSSRSRNNSFSSARFNFRPLTSSLSFNSIAASLNQILPRQHNVEQQIDKTTLVRLMGAISFGYGIFQLGVSLLPPSLTKLVSLLGFAANRDNGISCLMYARLGTDMRAPLASLSLLWYHTIVRPFYAIDGTNVQAGVEAASILIRESQKHFANSALFLFFGGRTSRLDSDITESLKSFQKANDNANHREIKILCLHEIGWCHLIQLDYENAKNTFSYLKCAGRWSRAFYGYLAAICIGTIQDVQSYVIFNDLHSYVGNTRGGQLDEFLHRRTQCCPKNAAVAEKYNSIYFKLLIFEMLYLWNALASCSKEDIERIIIDCKSVNLPIDEPRNGLADLILGSCYTILKDFPVAIDSYKKCLQKRMDELNNAEDAHISAFAQHELGQILLQREETKEEGKLLLQQISKYNNYDFEARLNVRIHNTLKHI